MNECGAQTNTLHHLDWRKTFATTVYERILYGIKTAQTITSNFYRNNRRRFTLK
jgi:hypothetical protein